MANIVSPDVPIDELGLLIIAQMYHAHIAVITKDYTWTSGFNLFAKECKFIFTYAGGISFHMVCNQVEEFRRPQKQPLNLSKRKNNQHSSSHKCSSMTPLSIAHTKRSKHHKSTRLVSVPLPYKIVKKRQMKTSQKAASQLSKLSLLKKNREHKWYAAPTNLKEEDPIADHLSNPSEVDDPKSDSASDYHTEDEKNIETIETEAGALAIARHGLRKPE